MRTKKSFSIKLSQPQILFWPIAIRSFLGPAADIVGALPQQTLMLTDLFKQRYLRDELDWQRDIRPTVQAFLRAKVVESSRLRLILDAHASAAFIAGVSSIWPFGAAPACLK